MNGDFETNLELALDKQWGDNPRTGNVGMIFATLYIAKAILIGFKLLCAATGRERDTMAKGRRERLLELHMQARNNVSRALVDMDKMVDMYSAGAPDRAAEIGLYAQNLLIWIEAWGHFKSDRM